VIFVHNDWNERGKIETLRRRVAEALPATSRIVGVVPVRETEAWPLVDERAFPRVRARPVVTLPARPEEVESVADPTALLEQALGSPYDERLAEMDRRANRPGALAQVTAYDSFLQDLTTALKELHFL
jgi:hypothetical protein